MNKPVISIITICYNSEASIEETINSVLGNGYPNTDYVIIDGGSTDSTLQIIEKYKSKLGYFISEKDKGISDAFNKGVAAAKGDIIGIINSDDILLPGALQKMAEAFDGTTDVYRGNVMIANLETNYRGREIPSMHFPFAPLTVCCAHQGTFITPEAYRKYGCYDVRFKFMMDYDLLTRYYRHGAKMKYVNADVAEFRIGGVSMTPYYKKRYDIMHVILNNGGSRFLACYYYVYMVLYDVARRCIVKLFNLNFLKRLHYGQIKS